MIVLVNVIWIKVEEKDIGQKGKKNSYWKVAKISHGLQGIAE